MHLAMASSQRSGIDFRDEDSLHSRLFKISTEQQIIIGKDSAWHISPSNIPPIVLDNVKEHVARQRERMALKTSETSPRSPNEHRNGQTRSPALHDVEAFDSQAEDLGDEDDKLGSSWGSSPASHRFPPGYVPEETRGTADDEWVESPAYSTNPPTQARGHAAEVEIEDEEPADDFQTQLPERSPPLPTATKSVRPTRPGFDFPSSSLGQEDEMEIDIPTGLGVSVLPTNPAFALVMATPPSAQVVPCSLDPTGSHGHHEHQENQHHQPNPNNKPRTKQTRYAPVTTLYRPSKEVDNFTRSVMGVHKGQSLENEKSSLPHTFSDTSSSIVPSTQQESSRPPETFQNPQEQQNQVQASPANQNGQAQPPMATKTVAEPFETQKHTYQDSVPLTAQPVLTTSMKEIVGPQPQPPDQPAQELAPYAQFCETYGDYTGDIQSFITACCYIQLQQKKIRSSLYDDFIRAWHDDYYAYVKRCDRADPPVKALHAYAWYNEMDDDPIYTERVITKLNLEATLGCYTEIAIAAKKTLGIIVEDQPKTALKKKPRTTLAERQKEMPEVRSSVADDIEKHAITASLPPLQQQTKVTPEPVRPTEDPTITDDDIEDDVEEYIEDDIPMGIPQAAVFSRHQQRRVSPPPADFSKSMSEIDLRHQPWPASEAREKPAARSLARSLSEASKNNHKRKASAEVIDVARATRRASPIMKAKPNNPTAPRPAVPQTMSPPPRPTQPDQQPRATSPSLRAFNARSNPSSRAYTPVSRPKARVSLPATVGSPSSSAISLSFRPPSSTAGSTISTTIMKRRYANDPEKRRLMFKKFCERSARKVNEESIMSSAPTSAQRE